MCRAKICASIVMMALLGGAGIPAIASAEELPWVGQRLKLVPSLRLEVPVSERGPVRSFGPADLSDTGLRQAVFRGGGMLAPYTGAAGDGTSGSRVKPPWQTIGSVAFPWRNLRLIVGYGPDGSFSLML